MPAYLATHLVDVLTGTTTDAYGDTVDAATVAAHNVPAAVLEQSRRTDRYDTQTPRTIRTHIGRVPNGTPVNAGDRLRDVKTAKTWVVDSVQTNTNPVIAADVILELRTVP